MTKWALMSITNHLFFLAEDGALMEEGEGDEDCNLWLFPNEEYAERFIKKYALNYLVPIEMKPEGEVD